MTSAKIPDPTYGPGPRRSSKLEIVGQLRSTTTLENLMHRTLEAPMLTTPLTEGMCRTALRAPEAPERVTTLSLLTPKMPYRLDELASAVNEARLTRANDARATKSAERNLTYATEKPVEAIPYGQRQKKDCDMTTAGRFNRFTLVSEADSALTVDQNSGRGGDLHPYQAKTIRLNTARDAIITASREGK